jgi:hypothetical protein
LRPSARLSDDACNGRENFFKMHLKIHPAGMRQPAATPTINAGQTRPSIEAQTSHQTLVLPLERRAGSGRRL